MRQQINLYQDILIDKPKPLQSRQSGLLLLVTVLCLVLISVYSYWQNYNLNTEVKRLQAQQLVESTRIAALEKQYPERQKNVLLEEKIQRLEQEIQGQNRALSYFSGQDEDGNGKILASLEGLAQYPLKGIWLSRIRLLDGGTEVQLSGSAVKADTIPDYLDLIGENHIFGGKVFARLKLNRLKEQAGQVDFMLESSQEATR
ncbi:MAG: hypothetical protein OQK50_09740 [Deltaproteobacteria bacterium]|nr:hypothetical protein [Deltaproteobacteria bacterium]